MAGKLTEATGIIDRPIYGNPTARVFGRVMGTLAINSRQQVLLLQRILEGGMREYAGRHEETFLAKLHRDLATMDRKADRENWPGWDTSALGRAALEREKRG